MLHKGFHHKQNIFKMIFGACRNEWKKEVCYLSNLSKSRDCKSFQMVSKEFKKRIKHCKYFNTSPQKIIENIALDLNLEIISNNKFKKIKDFSLKNQYLSQKQLKILIKKYNN